MINKSTGGGCLRVGDSSCPQWDRAALNSHVIAHAAIGACPEADLLKCERVSHDYKLNCFHGTLLFHVCKRLSFIDVLAVALQHDVNKSARKR